MFLKKEKNSFDFKKLILDLNDYQKEMIDSSKLDSRNIYIETEETIITTINKIYNLVLFIARIEYINTVL